MKLGIIGEFNPQAETHIATNEAISHSNHKLKINIVSEWISTEAIPLHNLKSYSGFLIAPGSPYKNMDNVLNLIKYARNNNAPILGTCGGFQHMVIEYARNVLGIEDAEHAEYDPYSSKLIINRLVCSLIGKKLPIFITDQISLAYKMYQKDRIEENYYCNFGLNAQYQQLLHEQGFKTVGVDEEGEARILELNNHPFFLATLFVPQSRSSLENPHPIITTFLETLSRFR